MRLRAAGRTLSRVLALTLATLVCMLLLPTGIGASETYPLLRPDPDYVITEVPGKNYVYIDRLPMYFHPWNVFPNLTNGNVSLGWVYPLETVFSRVFEEQAASLGIKYWAVGLHIDTEPPVIHIGLYEPGEAEMRLAAELVRNVSRAVEEIAYSQLLDQAVEKVYASMVEQGKNVTLEEVRERETRALENALRALREARIVFYEAHAYVGMEDLLERESMELVEALRNGTLNIPVKLNCCIWNNIMGLIYGDVIYGDEKPTRQLMVEIFKEIRKVVDPNITVAITFWKKNPWVTMQATTVIPLNRTCQTTTTTPAETTTTETEHRETTTTTTVKPAETTTTTETRRKETATPTSWTTTTTPSTTQHEEGHEPSELLAAFTIAVIAAVLLPAILWKRR